MKSGVSADSAHCPQQLDYRHVLRHVTQVRYVSAGTGGAGGARESNCSPQQNY